MIMLIVGDIHITSKYAYRIVQEIRNFCDAYTSETHIVFVGDYMYHFNYDRKSLLKLYQLFIDLYKQDKHIYILAGNHDRIANQFVYEEWRLTFEFANNESRSIRFITMPEYHTIQWQECLFFPYYLPTHESIQSEKFQELLDSDHPKEQISGRANTKLWLMIWEWRKNKKSDKLLLIHHRYIVQTQFPGQFARFGYKSPWLSNELFEIDDLIMISWHLHKPFVHHNYLCVWSVWHSSPLEIDQQKFLFHLDVNTLTRTASNIQINPYVEIQSDIRITKEELLQKISIDFEEQKRLMQDGDLNVNVDDLQKVDLQKYSVTILSDSSYQDMQELVDDSVHTDTKDLKIKSFKRSLPEVIELLDASSKQLDTRIADRKELLSQYLEQKYGDIFGSFVDELEELDILK